MDDVDFTILAATSVLGDLVDVCPPAEACRDAFERMSRATVQMCLSGKRGPTSTIAPSGTYQSGPPPLLPPPCHQAIEHGDQIKSEDNAMPTQQYRPVYQPSQSVPHIPPSPQHQVMHQRSVSRASSTESYTQSAAAAEACRRQPIHFDDGFQELFTSPRPQHVTTTPTTYSPQQQHGFVQSPTTLTEGMQYHLSVFTHTQHQQSIYPQPQADMMIDPALQQPQPQYTPATPGEWGYIDMSQFGIPEAEMWEHDSWSEEGNAGQVDLFDGFFFGGGGS
jgi:hypothetical protein